MTVETVATAGRQFPGQQSDQGDPRPLPGPERLKELLLGVLKGRTNCVDGGNRQAGTSHAREIGSKGTANQLPGSIGFGQ